MELHIAKWIAKSKARKHPDQHLAVRHALAKQLARGIATAKLNYRVSLDSRIH